MKIVVAGSSGLIGRALVRVLRENGHEVLRLVRRTAVSDDELSWNPADREIGTAPLEGVDAVINLVGENIARGRWSAAQRERMLRSRVDATQTLVAACTRLTRKPSVFISASAVGYYGSRGEEELSETSTAGVGFLPETCLIWETNAEGAARAGVRTVLLRFGVVLATEGGALAKMLPVFRLGLGGKFGPGTQWMSWVSLDDAVGAIIHALGHSECRGALNVVAPGPVTNADFTATLASVLARPAGFGVPAWLLRVTLGQMAVETLLASARVSPGKLQETGYVFRHAALEPALRAILRR